MPESILSLDSIDTRHTTLVGGKAANLAAAHAAGFAVPEGFCITTSAWRETLNIAEEVSTLDEIPATATSRLADIAAGIRDTIMDTALPDSLASEAIESYQRLGDDVAVAVRSSATAEDLPHASFAGQLDSFLDVRGEAAVLDAVRRCWASMWTDRAVSYRAANGIPHGEVAMAVIVQRLVNARVAGVLFTANPLNGSRSQQVVDAAPGLGEAVVSGTVIADHYVLTEGARTSRHGCLTPSELDDLWKLGSRLREAFGDEQDAEWAYDSDDNLWLTQSRPITTLFPKPVTGHPGDRVLMSVSNAQGVTQAMTPMGMSVMQLTAAALYELVHTKVDPIDGPPGFVPVGGQMYIDITPAVRSRRTREKLLDRVTVYGPRVRQGIATVLDDPRFPATPGGPLRTWPTLRAVARFALPALTTSIRALTSPQWGHRRVQLMAQRLRRQAEAPAGTTDAARMAVVSRMTRVILNQEMLAMVWVLTPAMIASHLPKTLLRKVATASEVDKVLRGMPHNPTTEMDLKLWAVATRARAHRDTLLAHSPESLTQRYREGTLPEELSLDIDEFLAEYGVRAAAEIDAGVPRWSEDPTPVLSTVLNYLRLDDPRQAPDKRFQDAADEAEATLVELVARAGGWRGRLSGFLLRRARGIAGLRELPKFASLHGIARARRELLAVGASLSGRGLLTTGDDIMFLTYREALSAVDGVDQRDLVAARRETHARDRRRRQVPVVLLSDGTDPEYDAEESHTDDGALRGLGAAPGRVTGIARVIHDPTAARLDPGEILVAPSTDPGWTPLFLTAGGLVTETGATMSHGPTVAREYGIPAVIAIRGATERIHTGQRITVDAAAGTVTLENG